MSVFEIFTISDNLIDNFAKLSGDYNAIHFDDKKAVEYGFKARIAHGMIAGAMISKVIASKLPGDGSIYLNQMLNFKAPIYVGDEIKVGIKIIKLKLAKRIVELETNVHKKEKVVVTWTASVKLK